MIVGMTGTRSGMTDRQKEKFKKLLIDLGCTELHHGDCVGADDEAHDIAREVGNIKIIVHPPEKDIHRAFKKGDEVRKSKGYHARNRDIVNSCDVLVGTPCSMTNKKGGTWYTINYALSNNVMTYVISPEGKHKLIGRDK